MALVIPIHFIINACVILTFTAELHRRIYSLESCLVGTLQNRLLQAVDMVPQDNCISYKDRINNEHVRTTIVKHMCM